MTLALWTVLIVAFIFSGLEAGLLSINRMRLRRRASEGVPAALTLEKLLEHPDRLTVMVVLVTQVARLVLLILLFQNLEEALGFTGAFWGVVVLLPALALVLEFLPKLIFRKFPYRLLVVFARILQGCDRIFGPILALGRHLGIEKFLRERNRWSEDSASSDPTELRRAFNAATSAGVLQPLQKHFLHSILNAREICADSLSRDLAGLQPVPGRLPVGETLRIAEERNVEYLLVSDEDGAPLGYLRRMDLLLDGVSTGRAQSYVRQLITVPPETPLLEAILKLRAARAPLALCPREDAAPGILAAEDLVRRLLHGPGSLD